METQGGVRRPAILILYGGPRPALDYRASARNNRHLAELCESLGFSPVVRRVVDEAGVLEALDFYEPSLVVSTLNYLPSAGGRPRLVHETLARSGRAFVGSRASALAACFSRSRAQTLWADHGLPLPPASPQAQAPSRTFSVVMLGGSHGRALFGAELPQPRAQDLIRRPPGCGDLGLNPLTRPGPGLYAEVCRFGEAALLSLGLEDWARIDLWLHEGKLYPLSVATKPPVLDPLTLAIPGLGGLGPGQVLGAACLAALERSPKRDGTPASVPQALEEALGPGLLEQLRATGSGASAVGAA